MAFDYNEDGSVMYYFDPETVVGADPELWYFPDARTDTMTLPSGSSINRLSIKRAAACGYYTRERLDQMNYKPVEEPVAFTYRTDKSVIYFYDKRTCDRVPLPCIRCGKGVRFRKKLCIGSCHLGFRHKYRKIFIYFGFHTGFIIVYIVSIICICRNVHKS